MSTGNRNMMVIELNKQKETIAALINSNRINQAMTLLYKSKGFIEDFIKQSTPKPIPENIKLLYKQTLSNLALCAYKEHKYKESIEYDKLLLKIDEQYDKCYARLFKSFLAINQRQEAVLYGTMLKAKFTDDTLNKYSDLLPLIDQETELYKQESSTWHILPHDKHNSAFYLKLIFILCSIAYIIWCFMHRKELDRRPSPKPKSN